MKKMPAYKPGPIQFIKSVSRSIHRSALALILILLLGQLTGCAANSSRQATPTPIPTPLIPIKPVYTVQRGEIVDLTRFSGRIAPVREAELAFGTSGRNVDLAQMELDLTHQQMPVARQAYSMTLTVKENQFTQAQMELDRLRKAGYTGSTLLQAENDLKLAQLDLELARQQVALDIAADEANLVRKERELELAQVDLNELETSIADAQIQAPFAGLVVFVILKEDTMADAYRAAVILADTEDLVIRANPGSEDLQRLEEGMPVTVSQVGKPDAALVGSIKSLPYPYGSGGSDQDDAFITLEDDLSLNEYQLGDLMEITVLLAQEADALWLPPQAVRTFEGRNFVVVQEAGGQRRVDVKIGIRGEDKLEILEGLEEGQTVLSP